MEAVARGGHALFANRDGRTGGWSRYRAWKREKALRTRKEGRRVDEEVLCWQVQSPDGQSKNQRHPGSCATIVTNTFMVPCKEYVARGKECLREGTVQEIGRAHV